MPKKKPKRRRQARAYVSKLTPARYDKYFLALLEGQEAAVKNRVYWDLGPGERANVVMADFLFIIRKEKLDIRVEVARNGQSLVFIYPEPGIENKRFRIRDKAGGIKWEQTLADRPKS